MPIDGRPLVALGEVRTCLLPNSAALSRDAAVDLLDVVLGRPGLSRERPLDWAESPRLAVGIDCQLVPHVRSRGVGTVATNALVIGGRVLQSSAHAIVAPAATSSGRRQTWAHYLGRVGTVELLTGASATIADRLVVGFLSTARAADPVLDITAISTRLLTKVHSDVRLDRQPPLLVEPTRLRWAARVVPGAQASVLFGLHQDRTRTALVTVGSADDLPEVRRYCQDLAVHDWLLTAVIDVIEDAEFAQTSGSTPESVLAPALQHLAHLWMPSAHTPPLLRCLWEQLENDPGFSRQWNARIGQLRDRVAVATLAALHRTSAQVRQW
ncbi:MULTISPECIES: SCO2521 family protein [unclassified Nocardia]|uniref:SCO2521 family protein n=1 Tax=Nocardia sp. NPDC060220 TaxID=3347076 RepID=UPI0036653682